MEKDDGMHACIKCLSDDRIQWTSTCFSDWTSDTKISMRSLFAINSSSKVNT